MWPPQPGQSCRARCSTRSRSGRARANNLAISCLQKQSKHYSLNARASQPCRSRKKLARPPDRLCGPPPRLGGGLCRRGLVEPLGPADDARLGRDAAAQSQSTGEGRSAAQSSGGLRAVANRPGSSAAALCRRPPGQPRHTGCCEPTRIECCCALSKAARSAASHGLLRTDQDRVLLRFVEGRPVSRVTTDFLAWGADRLAAEDKRVWVLVWDNAAWHVSRAVQAWIGTHNRTVKRTGGVRILVCRLPVKSPWLNPIEPRWLHGKRAVLEPERTSTAHELMDRVHQHFGCERLEPLHQHVR